MHIFGLGEEAGVLGGGPWGTGRAHRLEERFEPPIQDLKLPNQYNQTNIKNDLSPSLHLLEFGSV